MNSIIVSETCTAPTAPIQVPLTQLSPLSQTCLSCPYSVTLLLLLHHPHPALALSFTDTSIFQSLAGPPARNPLHFTSLFPWQPAGGRGGGSVPPTPRGPRGGGGERCPSRPLRGEGIFGDGVVGKRHGGNSAWWGSSFGRGSFALLRDTMGPRLLKEAPHTHPHPPIHTAIIIRRGLQKPFE